MQVKVQYRPGFQIISSDGFAKYHFIAVTSCPADHFVNWYPTEYGKNDGEAVVGWSYEAYTGRPGIVKWSRLIKMIF